MGLVAAVLILVTSAEPLPPPGALLWAAGAGLSGVAGLGAFYLALSRGTMSIVAPLAALIGAALPALVGIAAGERVGGVRLLGLLVALAAVVLISLPGSPPAGAGQPARDGQNATPAAGGARRSRPGARPSARDSALVLAAGLGFAGFYLGIDGAAEAGGATWWPIAIVRLAGVALIAFVVAALVALRRLPPLRARRGLLPLYVVAGAGDLGGNLFFLLADTAGSLAVAVVISSLYPVVTAFLARLFLGERLSGPQLAGAAAAIVGVALIALGGVATA